MMDIIGWIITGLVTIIAILEIKSAVKTYKEMQTAKRKAQIWGARM